MSAFPDHPFWTFSLETYGKPGVSDACLELQDRLVVDVNLLLFCLWCAKAGRATFGEAEMAALLGQVEDWHENVVKPLRKARRRMKRGAEGVALDLVLDVRKRLSTIEIETEHLEQLLIAAAAGEGTSAPTDQSAEEVARANVRVYFHAIGARPDADDEAVLDQVLQAALEA
ncbi:TIGR02444 family protein [Amorphus sp. 3PC139-8]|uniref:TIGR02444 family protein n=1 Tax=Amorphus sp. 3PC139-8 TaxID=2735676 RepID=UPI00345CF06E